MRPSGPQPLSVLSGPLKRSIVAPFAFDDQSRTSVKSSAAPSAGRSKSVTGSSRYPVLRATISGYSPTGASMR
jgi:hypothetical protein